MAQQVESYNPERILKKIQGQGSRRKIMAEGAIRSEVATSISQAGNGEQSPISGVSPDLFKTLNQRHSLKTIQEQQGKYKTHEEFLEAAEKEAAHIRITQAQPKPAADLQPLPLSPGQIINGKEVSEEVLRNAGLEEGERAKAAAELLYGEGKELSEQQKQELLAGHEEASAEEGLNEGYLAGVYNLKPEQIRRKVAKLPSFTKEERRKLFEAGLVGAPDYLIEEAKQGSEFQEAVEIVILDAKLSPTRRAKIEASHPDHQKLVDDSKKRMNETILPVSPQDVAELDRVLSFVREDIRRVYLEAIQPAPQVDSDSWYSAPRAKTVEERIEAVNQVLGMDPKTGEFHYKETFWSYGEATLKKAFKDSTTGLDPDISVLREKYEGVARYIAARAANAMAKELMGQELKPDPTDSTKEEFGDFYLSDIQRELRETEGERARDRREKRKRATAEQRLKYNDWREKFDFNWAETPEELDDSVEDWLDYFQQALPLEAEESVYQEVQKGLSSALSSLEKARNRIGLEANDVRVFALREKIIGHVTTIAGARLLESKGGFEYYIKLRTDFASNYNPYYDAIYKKKGFAIMADKLSENEGEIYHGGPEDRKKPLAGDTRAFRGKLEREAIRYGATNELYITDNDFEEAVLGEEKIRRDVSNLGLSQNQAEKIIQDRLKEGLGRYGWGEDDAIEELLLYDARGFARADALIDPQQRVKAIARWQTRTEFFKAMKKALDKEDVYKDAQGNKISLASLNPDQRKRVIRERIRDKITEEGYTDLLLGIDNLPDQESQDRALWKWVRDYNRPRIELRKEGSNDEPWFPSHWDRERLTMLKPEDLIDRALSKEEFKAMVEEIDDQYRGLTDDQISEEITDDFKAQIISEVQAMNLSPQDATNEFAKLMKERQRDIKDKIEDELFKRKERETRAVRNFNLNRAQDKFIELEARWGGLTTRVINVDGEVELRTIYSLATEIIKAKIDKEADDIEKKLAIEWKPKYIADNPGITTEQLEEATIKQRRFLRRHATFAATLGLREIGIANDLPIWEYYYYGDVAEIGAFAPLVGYTDEDKGDLPALLDSGRREMEAVFFFLAQQHMDVKMLDVRDAPGLVIETEKIERNNKGKLEKTIVQQPAHEEKWVRPRVINEGGVLKLRDIFEKRFMVSTSGGVEVTDLIYKIGDLGIFDELWEHGCLDKREWQGFRKRRNKLELRTQNFFNTREWSDPITHVQRLAGAANAAKFLTGGEIQGKGHVPGVLVEPMSGAYKYRDMFYDAKTWLEENIANISMIDPKLEEKIKKELENLDNLKQIDPKVKDQLVEIGAGILKPLIDYMDARRYVMNRAGLAPKNWKYDNELMVNAYLNELFDEKVMGKDNLAYAAPGRSRVSTAIFKDILQTSTYHVLVEKDRRDLYDLAEWTKGEMAAARDAIVAKGLLIAVQSKINNRINKLRAQGMGTRIDSFKARGLVAPAVVDSIVEVDKKTEKEWKDKGATEEEITSLINLNKERERLKNQYYDEQLHKEFVGEWPARLKDFVKE